jgi:uncharacterized membrane protein YkoI
MRIKLPPNLTLAPACALISALLLPVPLAAESGTDTSAVPKGAKISQDQARQAALHEVPGKVTDLTVETKHGKPVYVVEVVAQKDNEETDVLVDMDTGKVIGVEH